MCPAVKRDLKSSIDSDQVLRKFMLVRPDDSPPRIPPVSLEPLLTIQDECYTLEKEICICGLQLSDSEIARLEVTRLWALCTGNCGNLGWAHVLTPIQMLPSEELLVAESAQSSSQWTSNS
ncbi:uncharacterized protein LOC103788807 [Callithrix jacchus]|uniref:uncharacterized protein LOC103788807 n=1 Tax=Callithrix jacchus TaxID=9483 RepID=UPI0004F02EA7|nr:uncharacterized protein LOC103788807 [Callithrix jacchus]